MFDFIALDFETANHMYHPCSAGFVIVQNGKIVHRDYTLINPESKFDSMCVKVHGITAVEVADAPTFPEFFTKLSAYMRRYPIVAHNASTERIVLERSCSRYNLSIPCTTLYDTYSMYRKNFPNYESYKLNALCSYRGIALQHHNALSDAIACAELMILLQQDESTIMFPSSILEQDRPNDTPSSYMHSFKSKVDSSNSLIMPDVIFDDVPIVLEGHSFVITGDIPQYGRTDILTAIQQHGGLTKDSIVKKLDYLAVGPLDPDVVTDKVSHKSSKIIKAEKYRDEGCNIKIIRLTDLVNFLFK